jgi:hypothetical protein
VKLPVKYDDLEWYERKRVRNEYIVVQNGKCFYCKESLDIEAPDWIKNKEVNWNLFPGGFLNHPIHLQHDHKTGLTEGAVHNYCNAVMWQYERR